jgi:hypothetical protein
LEIGQVFGHEFLKWFVLDIFERNIVLVHYMGSLICKLILKLIFEDFVAHLYEITIVLWSYELLLGPQTWGSLSCHCKYIKI